MTNLRERIAATARRLPIRLGPNALALASRGEVVHLSGGEADRLAEDVLDAVSEVLDAAQEDLGLLARRSYELEVGLQDLQEQNRRLKDQVRWATEFVMPCGNEGITIRGQSVGSGGPWWQVDAHWLEDLVDCPNLRQAWARGEQIKIERLHQLKKKGDTNASG